MERVRLRFEWHEPKPSRTARLRDPDNISSGGRKIILDGLVQAGVIPDDGWDVVRGWEDHFEIGGVIGCVVTLEEAQ
jgi:hypothetical protein